ncbi:hypothetical protein [Streptomyces sp. NPDC047315]|uniref:hypothetical protein n=1 Tax=Streptomyces sp. NPDC047315 TaxID=3155142 RepID=UPI0033F26DB3
MHGPEDQYAAGHIPTDVLRQLPPGTDPRHVVIVRTAPRSYTGPILLTVALASGAALIVLMIAVTLHVASVAAVAVLSATGGIGLTIKRSKGR